MIVVIVDESSDSLDSFGNPPSDLDQGTPFVIDQEWFGRAAPLLFLAMYTKAYKRYY